MQISANGTLTGAVGLQRLWMWPAASDRPTTLNVWGHSPGFLQGNLVAMAANVEVFATPGGMVEWADPVANGTPTVRSSNTGTTFLCAGDQWLASEQSIAGWVTWGNLKGVSVVWHALMTEATEALALQSDGSYVVRVTSNAHPLFVDGVDGKTIPLIRDTGTFRSLRDGLVLCHDEAADRVALYTRDGEMRCEVVPGSSEPLLALRIRNVPWIIYRHRDAAGSTRVYCHPYNDASAPRVLTTGPCFGLDAVLSGTVMLTGWALTANEAYNADPYYQHVVRAQFAV